MTLVLALLVALAASPVASAQGFQLVVNTSNQVSSLSKQQVSRMLLKKLTSWPDGGRVKPVDQAGARAVRKSFSQAVHGKKVGAVQSYWQKMTFSGRATPPPELTSDRDVLKYVRNNAGAIGYVSAGTSLGEGVKAIRVTE